MKMLKIVSTDLLTRKCAKIAVRNLVTATQTQDRIVSFRTSEVKAAEHSVDNVAQFYRISPEANNRLFLHGGLPKSFATQTKTFAETCLMIRQPALDVIGCIKTIDFNKPVVRFVLYGKLGNGKSLSLAHVIHYGYEAGYLMVHVPWVGRWMRYCKECSNSESKEGCVDINFDAAGWLIHFKTQNSQMLAQPEFVTDQDYVWSKREMTPKNSSLLELIDHGINRIKYASDCVVILCKEIKRLSTEGKCKTMVVIDGYNAFFYPNTRVYTEKKEMVPPSRVTLTEGFLELTKTDWKNGVCILSADEMAIAAPDQISHFPKYLLGKTGFEHVDPFIPVHVPAYSSKEFLSCMEYYRERKWVQPFHGQDEELSFLSTSNPFKLMELCASL